jgi:tripartite-type tricarboxylate transporter receptor subunit TctC
MKLTRRKFLHLAAGAAALPVLPRAARAQAYPSRPVKIVVPLPPASAPDIKARIIADQLTKMWDRQVIVEDRPGGGGAIAVHAVLSALPDGHTLLYAVSSVFTVLPAQKNKPTFDVNRDLIPIGLTSNEGMAFAVSAKLGVKRDPYKFIIGTNPAGSLPHLAATQFVRLSKAPMTVVPSTGGTNDAIREIMGGRSHAVIEELYGLRGAIDAGDLKALAIMSRERVPMAPDLPTAAETVPGLIALGFSALVAPKGTPGAIVRQLSEDLRKVLQDPDTLARFEKIGGTPFHPIFAADLARFIASEQMQWWPVVKLVESN